MQPTIIFEKLRWRNFLSTGNVFTEMSLNEHKTTLIVGLNGSGKSTMLDALCFALFGKAFRNLNKPKLVNSINKKDCVVEVEFSIHGDRYKVIRGIKPNIFEIYKNDELIDQDAASKDYQSYLESSILQFNYKAFTQIVLLGSSSYTAFMRLSAADRRAVVDDLLDIAILTDMAALARAESSIIKNDLREAENEKKRLMDKAQYHKRLMDKAMQQKETLVESKKDEREANINLGIAIAKENKLLQSTVTNLKESVSDAGNVRACLSKEQMGYAVIEHELVTLQETVQFFRSHDTCPTCTQDISDELRESRIDSCERTIEDKRQENEKTKHVIADLESAITKIETIENEIRDVRNKIQMNSSMMLQLRDTIEKQNAEIQVLSESGDVTELKREAKEIYQQYRSNEVRLQALKSEKEYNDAAVELLKDGGIKASIIAQYVPVINNLVNKYLADFDFFVNFEMDSEFKETLRSRHRDDFSYENFSEGERMRIDLSLLFAFRALANMRNSINTNLLIMDEIFDSAVDAPGIDGLFAVLKEQTNSNVFLISHKTDALLDRFEKTIQFSKVQNFSEMSEVVL